MKNLLVVVNPILMQSSKKKVISIGVSYIDRKNMIRRYVS